MDYLYSFQQVPAGRDAKIAVHRVVKQSAVSVVVDTNPCGEWSPASGVLLYPHVTGVSERVRRFDRRALETTGVGRTAKWFQPSYYVDPVKLQGEIK